MTTSAVGSAATRTSAEKRWITIRVCTRYGVFNQVHVRRLGHLPHLTSPGCRRQPRLPRRGCQRRITAFWYAHTTVCNRSRTPILAMARPGCRCRGDAGPGRPARRRRHRHRCRRSRTPGREISDYDGRHAVFPGITGLAQLHLPPDTEVAHVERQADATTCITPATCRARARPVDPGRDRAARCSACPPAVARLVVPLSRDRSCRPSDPPVHTGGRGRMLSPLT